ANSDEAIGLTPNECKDLAKTTEPAFSVYSRHAGDLCPSNDGAQHASHGDLSQALYRLGHLEHQCVRWDHPPAELFTQQRSKVDDRAGRRAAGGALARHQFTYQLPY